MAITVKMDQLQDASCRQTADGWELQRLAFVSGLSGSYAQRMAQAMTASGIPALREAHPNLPGVLVAELQASPAGDQAAMVRITYRSPDADFLPDLEDPPQIQVGSTLSQTTTSQDATGQPIEVTIGSGANTLTQIAQVRKLIPQTTVRYTRLEEASPGDKARNYVGKINSTAVFSSNPETWMCTGIHGRSDDGGQTYLVTYDFQYNPDGWQPKAVYIDPTTGRPHPDATPIQADIYNTIDFTNLDL